MEQNTCNSCKGFLSEDKWQVHTTKQHGVLCQECYDAIFEVWYGEPTQEFYINADSKEGGRRL